MKFALTGKRSSLIVSEVLPYGKVVAAFYNFSTFLNVNKIRLGISAEAGLF